jgi:hypothetical protein
MSLGYVPLALGPAMLVVAGFSVVQSEHASDASGHAVATLNRLAVGACPGDPFS